MINLNSEYSNSQFSASQKNSSNTPAFLHIPLTLSTNSFNSLLPLLTDSHFSLSIFHIHPDYLRVSTSGLTKLSFSKLKNYLFDGQDTRTINKFWHPNPKTPNTKKYPHRIVTDTGVVLAYRKRAKNRGANRRIVYDIMIELYGSYFADLSLLEQLELICYLNSNWQLKCHRIDVAVDDYSGKLFPLLQISVALEQGNYFGFKTIDEEYLYCFPKGCVGTIALGSRKHNHYVRIYTKGIKNNRWEAELKQDKAQDLFNELASFNTEKLQDIEQIKTLLKLLVEAVFGDKDFRDKNSCSTTKNTTRKRTTRLGFFERTNKIVFDTIENQSISNYQKLT